MRNVIIVIFVLLLGLYSSPSYAKNSSTYYIYCSNYYMNETNTNNTTEAVGIQKWLMSRSSNKTNLIIHDKWMKISFDYKLTWPTDIDGKFSPSEIDYKSSDNLFGIVMEVDSKYLVVDTSPIALSNNEFLLSQECAEYIIKNIFSNRSAKNFKLQTAYSGREVHFARNKFGNYIYDRCDLDHKYMILKYKRTRECGIPIAWFFNKTICENKQLLTPYYFPQFGTEYPVETDTWDLYWAYSIGDYDSVYDPTLYHEWWSFVAYYEYEIMAPDDPSRCIVYLSESLPGSISDYYTISKCATFDTTN
jgi:hypothetical protein